MPRRRLHLTTPPDATSTRDEADRGAGVDVPAALAALRREMEIPAEFPADARAEADAAAATLPARTAPSADRADLRALPFVTIDPPGSMDLDQALFLEREGARLVVHYAIADVGAFVVPGGALDAAVHERGSTLYAPDGRTPLHPPVLSEGAASLLPGVDRPAAVWRIVLDAAGEILEATVRRAVVRSRERLTYAEAQSRLDAEGDFPRAEGDVPRAEGDDVASSLALLRTVGELRLARERSRGGVSLEVPEQEVVTRPDGTYALTLRSTLPVEGWNAQVSLLTGIAAARIMRAGGVGVLRTLPAADPRDLERLRRTAGALGIEWPATASYGDLLPALDADVPRHSAFLHEATSLFRGASYEAFGGTGQEPGVPDDVAHAAIAAEYAHVTAPLRRLVDRYGTEVCLALCAGEPVPRWVLDALPGLPRTMARTGQRAGSFERAVLDVVEAAVLAGREGEVFDAVVVDVDDDGGRGRVLLTDPAVRATVEGDALPLGEPVRVVLREVSVAERRVRFALETTP